MSQLDAVTGRLIIDDLPVPIEPGLERSELLQAVPSAQDFVGKRPQYGYLFRPVQIGGRSFGLVLRFTSEILERVSVAELHDASEQEIHWRHIRWLQAQLQTRREPPYEFPWGQIEATHQPDSGAGIYLTYQFITWR